MRASLFIKDIHIVQWVKKSFKKEEEKKVRLKQLFHDVHQKYMVADDDDFQSVRLLTKLPDIAVADTYLYSLFLVVFSIAGSLLL